MKEQEKLRWVIIILALLYLKTMSLRQHAHN